MKKSLMVLRKFETCQYFTHSGAHLREFLNLFSWMMRQIFNHQLSLDHVPIEDIQLDLNSRDPFVAFLFGIQSILTNNAACKKLTALLKTHNPKISNIVVDRV